MEQKKDLIYSNQLSLYGSREIIGFGSNEFYIKEIDRLYANEIIIKNHYSKKVFNNSFIHLGVFINGVLLGVLQFGHLMNNDSVSKIVKNTNNGEAIELNRMWLNDEAGKNSESKAFSYAVRFIRSKFRFVKWIQSFADERCKCFGIVYQACNFIYYGEHLSEFYEFDGEIYHKIMFTNTGKSASNSSKARHLRANIDKANKFKLRQFRYIFFLDNRLRKDCLLKEMPYPKHYNNLKDE